MTCDCKDASCYAANRDITPRVILQRMEAVQLQGAGVNSLSFIGAVAFSLFRTSILPGTGPIHMDDVGCHGNELRLIDCAHSTTANCLHFEDAGVRCSPVPSKETRKSLVTRQK